MVVESLLTFISVSGFEPFIFCPHIISSGADIPLPSPPIITTFPLPDAWLVFCDEAD